MISTRPNFVRRISSVAFALSILAGVFLILGAGPVPQMIYVADVTSYLDACFRTASGQRIGVDFSSPVGPAALLPTVLGMRLNGPDVHALVFGSAFAWVAFGLAAWAVARPRLKPPLAAGFSLFVAATAAAPYPLDFGNWNTLSYGLLYNRLAWAALCVAIVAVFVPRSDAAPPRGVAVGLGAISVLLWAIKPNYLLVLLPIMILDWSRAPRRGRWLAQATAGAAILFLIVSICVPFSPLGYLEIHLGMARQAPADLLAYTWNRTLRENFTPIFVLVVIVSVIFRSSLAGASRRSLILAGLAVVAATLITNLTNCQFSEIPVWAALAWCCATFSAGRDLASRCARLAAVAFALAFTWQPLASIAYGYAWKVFRHPGTPPALEVESAAWRGLPLRAIPGTPADPGGDLFSAANYARWLNDGLALLVRHPGAESILSLDWNNPFPFATGTRPPLGDEIAWHVGRNVRPLFHPDFARILTGVNYVMEPQRSLQPFSLSFKQLAFAPGLAASFVVVEESDHWRLWVRRAPALSSVPH